MRSTRPASGRIPARVTSLSPRARPSARPLRGDCANRAHAGRPHPRRRDGCGRHVPDESARNAPAARATKPAARGLPAATRPWSSVGARAADVTPTSESSINNCSHRQPPSSRNQIAGPFSLAEHFGSIPGEASASYFMIDSPAGETRLNDVFGLNFDLAGDLRVGGRARDLRPGALGLNAFVEPRVARAVAAGDGRHHLVDSSEDGLPPCVRSRAGNPPAS